MRKDFSVQMVLSLTKYLYFRKSFSQTYCILLFRRKIRLVYASSYTLQQQWIMQHLPINKISFVHWQQLKLVRNYRSQIILCVILYQFPNVNFATERNIKRLYRNYITFYHLKFIQALYHGIWMVSVGEYTIRKHSSTIFYQCFVKVSSGNHSLGSCQVGDLKEVIQPSNLIIIS